jgi:hypothetical protein
MNAFHCQGTIGSAGGEMVVAEWNDVWGVVGLLQKLDMTSRDFARKVCMSYNSSSAEHLSEMIL